MHNDSVDKFTGRAQISTRPSTVQMYRTVVRVVLQQQSGKYREHGKKSEEATLKTHTKKSETPALRHQLSTA